MSLPQKLQEYRRREKLSQEELANRLGVSRQSVSKWEQGLSFPETDKLIELSTMMGVTIDSLLKDSPEPPPPEEAPTEPPVPSKSPVWLKALAVVLIVLVAVIALITPRPNAGDPAHPTETAPINQTETTLPNETESLPTETVPQQTEPAFRNEDLAELQAWFFDFARTYRLDYLPTFTEEAGPPTDVAEYLYWAFAINLDNWGEDKGTMTKTYIADTVWQYFRTPAGSHRSLEKQWEYDSVTECYTAYPGGLKQLDYYLLTGIEIDQGKYTVQATRFRSRFYGYSQEEEARLIASLFDGTATDLFAVSELTVTFRLDPDAESAPIFLSYSEEFLSDLYS